MSCNWPADSLTLSRRACTDPMSPRFSPRFVWPFSLVFSFFLPFFFFSSLAGSRAPTFVHPCLQSLCTMWAWNVGRKGWGGFFFFISFNCSVHYPMQIKIIRRLKDVFIFHSSIYISLFLSLLRPLRLPRYLCPSPFVASVFPLSLISTLPLVAYHVRFFSLFLFPAIPLFSPLLLPSSPPFLYLVLWWRVQHHHYFISLFPWFFLFLCPTDDAVSPRFLRFPPRCTEHSPPFLPTRFCFKRL